MRSKILIIVLLTLTIASASEAMQFMGGKSLFYTQTAQNFAPGQLTAAFYARVYAKPGLVGRDIRNNATAFCGTFGFTKRMEMSITQIIYQDLNSNNIDPTVNYQFLGYTQFSIKFGNYKFDFMGNKPLYFAYRFSGTMQGKYYNTYLEPYYDAGKAGQVDFLFSYFENPIYPEESNQYHFNLGYTNYNDGEKIMESAQALPFAFAFVKSQLKREFAVELNSSFFIQRPIETAYSRENYIYLTPSFKYKIYLGLAVGVAIDALLYTEEEQSSYNLPSSKYPQYPLWRINFKLEYLPSTAFYEVPTFSEVSKEAITKESLRARRVITDKKSLFEWVVDENMGAEYIDLELEKIRAERKQAEAELDRLKQELEAKSGK